MWERPLGMVTKFVMFIALVTIVVMLWLYHQNMFLFIWKIDFYLFTNFLKLSNQLKKEIAIDTLVRTKNIFDWNNQQKQKCEGVLSEDEKNLVIWS